MKHSILFFILAFIGFNTVAIAQKGKTGEVIKAVKISQETAEEYWGKYIDMGFTVDRRNVLRAEKGYEILLLSGKQQFVVKPIGIDYNGSGNFDVENVPGGTMFCMCAVANDDCEISVNVEGDTISYFCDGGCGCGKFTIMDIQKDYPEYQSMQGDWSAFDY
jgi:hypothetical protein